MTYGVRLELGAMTEGVLADDVFNFWAQALKGKLESRGP